MPTAADWSLRSELRGMRAAAGRGAFSLTELVVVVLIIGIFTAVAVPAFVESLVFHRVESAARRVKADLELARQTARLTSATQTITFTGSAYTASAGVDGLNQPGAVYAVDLSAPPYELTGVDADFGGDTFIAFDGYGAHSSGGEIILTAPKHQCTVKINANSGQISISRDHDNPRSPE